MNKKHIIGVVVGMSMIASLLTSCSNKASSTKTTQKESTQSDSSQIETYFTRKDGKLDQVLIKQMNSAEKNLNVAIYSLTKENIADAILQAKKRGVDVKIITDKQESETKSEKAILDKLKADNIPVKINNHAGLMHLKLTVVDDKIACGGSYNYTENATKENDENLIVMRDSNIVEAYLDEYNSMWNNTSDYKSY